ncbi:calcium-binding protein [Anabaena catenula]|uniref:Calcium-binding protein n=1 Tax=Anabaena catenula FACHB-362 TaxID=2692877 RepID=A0ABR8J0B2_9NOST|nr:calcium-binding protein [Anabaena catenula]MBD2691290.1 hypothetical protein [Anabaena catenula FACHB-362]
MANIVLFQGNRYTGDTTWLAQYYGAQTSTNFEVLDSSGVLRESNVGINFTYGWNGFFNSGTITSVYYFGSNGQLKSQETNLNVDVATRNSLLTIGTSSYDYYQYYYRGNDSFLGSASDDLFYGSKGNDTINGGAGIDVLTFQKFSQGVTVNLSTGKAITSYGTSVISNVEDIEGSAYGDVLTGNAGNNQIQGFGGADTINGGAGFDTVVYFDATSAVNVNLSTGVVTGGSGNDTLVSIERVFGSRFNDVLTGSAANESFLGGFGADTINGGGGIDTVEYGFVGSGVVVNLATGLASGSAGNDIISNVENVTGSIFNDTITGNAVANVLNGDNGNDVLNGGGGKDSLNGGAGNDTLTGAGTDNGVGSIDTFTGGSGNDRFILSSSTTAFYNDGNNSSSGLGDYALIKDFNSTQDKIQLEGSASKYILGTSPISGVSGTAIYLDTNNNGIFNSTDELVGIVQGSSGLNRTASYFVYV